MGDLEFTPAKLEALTANGKFLHIDLSVAALVDVTKNLVHVFPFARHGLSESQ